MVIEIRATVTWKKCDLTRSMYRRRRKRQPTPVFMPGKSHGLRSLVGYNPRGRKESDTTEWLLCVCVCIGDASKVAQSTCSVEDTKDVGSIPESGRSPGREHGNPLHYSCMENPMDKRSLVGYSP